MWRNFVYGGIPGTRSSQNYARPFRQTNLCIFLEPRGAGGRRAHGEHWTRTLTHKLVKKIIAKKEADSIGSDDRIGIQKPLLIDAGILRPRRMSFHQLRA